MSRDSDESGFAEIGRRGSECIESDQYNTEPVRLNALHRRKPTPFGSPVPLIVRPRISVNQVVLRSLRASPTPMHEAGREISLSSVLISLLALVAAFFVAASQSSLALGVWAVAFFTVMYGVQYAASKRGHKGAWESERFRLFLALTGAVLSSSAHGAAVLYSSQAAMEMACFGYAVALFILSIPFGVPRFSVLLIPFLCHLGVLIARRTGTGLLPVHLLSVGCFLLIPSVVMIGYRLRDDSRTRLLAQGLYLYLCVWVGAGLLLSGPTWEQWIKDRAPHRLRGGGVIYVHSGGGTQVGSATLAELV